MGYVAFGFNPVECRSRGSLDFVQLSRSLEASFPVASSVAAVVGEAYIVGASPKCQHRFRCFLNFLRHVREGAAQPAYVGSEAPFQLSLIGDGDRGPSIQAPAQLRPHSQTKPGTRIRRGSGSGGVRIVSRRRRGGNRAFVDLKRPGRQLSRPTNDNASPGETVLLNAGYRGNHRCAGRRAATDW